MKLFKLKLVLDIFTSHVRYSKVTLEQLFLLYFEKNCKIINQYYKTIKNAQVTSGTHERVWCSWLLVRIARVARIARRTLVNKKKPDNNGKFSKYIVPFSDKRLRFNLSNGRHPNKLSQNLLSNVLEHRNNFFTLENSKKLMLNVSTIPWISEEFF